MNNTQLLNQDAKNRALRTFLQGLGIDILVAIAVWAVSVFATAGGWGDIQWVIVSFTLAKTVVQSVAAYIMRRFVDGSAMPTPLPPEPAAEPADDVRF